MVLTALPRRLEIRHRLFTGRRIATIMRVLRQARRDRPEPRRVPAGRVRPHDPAYVLPAVEYVVVVIRPCAAWVGLRSAFQDQHRISLIPTPHKTIRKAAGEFCVARTTQGAKIARQGHRPALLPIRFPKPVFWAAAFTDYVDFIGLHGEI